MARPTYRIEVNKLTDGRHPIVFQLTGELFAQVPETDIAGADIAVAGYLDKTPRHIDVHLELTGWVELACDRCLVPYRFALATQGRLVYSHDPVAQDTDDDTLRFLRRDAQWLDLTDELYEIAALCVPLRKVPENCPGPQCPPEVLARLLDDEPTDAPESELARQLKEQLHKTGNSPR
ncbi:MAG: DUF177 domain-containing protein [Bacteroidia bacterium]|nr:DUF177 domain-containing protein [Bacteroidia bacterium]